MRTVLASAPTLRASASPTNPVTKRPQSVKRPHWVLLGFDATLAKSRKVVHDTNLVVYRTQEEAELRVALDACPHRGASLSEGVVKGQCVVCPYHSRSVDIRTHPERFYDYAVQDGLVWLDFASSLVTQHHPPPSYPEHSDPNMRTFEYSKTLRVNPVLMVENTLDWQHLSSVHRVHFIKGLPKVDILKRGAHGHATYTYDSDIFDLVIDNEYHVPFTTSLRFRFTDKRTGEKLPALLLWFSVTPGSGDEVTLNLRVSRGVFRSPLADWIFRLIDELPLLEDAHVVSTVDPGAWSSNKLDASDEFVAEYRKAMTSLYPEILEWYVS